jgi:hypothetical protein
VDGADESVPTASDHACSQSPSHIFRSTKLRVGAFGKSLALLADDRIITAVPAQAIFLSEENSGV